VIFEGKQKGPDLRQIDGRPAREVRFCEMTYKKIVTFDECAMRLSEKGFGCIDRKSSSRLCSIEKRGKTEAWTKTAGAKKSAPGDPGAVLKCSVVHAAILDLIKSVVKN